MTRFARRICSRIFHRRCATRIPAGRRPRQSATSELRSKPLVKAAPTADGAEGFALNFENTPVATVAKVVLGDILNVGYVIDPRAQGTISLSSGRPVAKRDMLFVLENALRVNNLVLVRDPVGYRILPATDGAVGSVDRPGANGASRARIRLDRHPGPIRIGHDPGQVDGGLRLQAGHDPNGSRAARSCSSWEPAPSARRQSTRFVVSMSTGYGDSPSASTPSTMARRLRWSRNWKKSWTRTRVDWAIIW